jgi:hypothetical protein
MGLRAKLSRLQKAMRGNMDYIELVDGSRHWFDPEDASKELFLYFTDSLGATDREAAFRRAYSMAPAPWCPLDVPALVERGEFVPRSLVAGQTEDGPIPDLSE